MIFEIIGILTVVILIAFIINGIEDYHKRIIPFIEFEKVEYPIVEFESEGKKLTFMIDSGSNVSFISSNVLHSIKHDFANYTMDVSGIENSHEIVDFFNITINYKDISFINTFGEKNIDFSVITNNSGVHIDGIIGSLFLDKYNMTLDFNNHRLIVLK